MTTRILTEEDLKKFIPTSAELDYNLLDRMYEERPIEICDVNDFFKIPLMEGYKGNIYKLEDLKSRELCSPTTPPFLDSFFLKKNEDPKTENKINFSNIDNNNESSNEQPEKQ